VRTKWAGSRSLGWRNMPYSTAKLKRQIQADGKVGMLHKESDIRVMHDEE